MQKAGYRTVHFGDFMGFLSDRIYSSIQEGRELFSYLTNYDCIVLSSILAYPQLENISRFTEQYPDSYFVLNKRDPVSHFSSMSRYFRKSTHSGVGLPFCCPTAFFHLCFMVWGCPPHLEMWLKRVIAVLTHVLH